MTQAQIEAARSTFFMIFIIITIVGFVLAIGLLFAFFLKRRPKGSVLLNSSNTVQHLDENESQYFSSIRYDGKGSLVLIQKGDYKKCVVSVVAKSNSKKTFKRYTLEYSNGDKVAAIEVGDIEEYAVFVDSVDKQIIKHPAVDTFLLFTIIYGALISVIFIGALFVYVMLDSYYLSQPWIGYGAYYILSALGLLFAAVVIGGNIIFEIISKKGGF